MLKLIFANLIKLSWAVFFAAGLIGLSLLMFSTRPAYAQEPVVNIGDLPPGKVVTITFRAAITSPFPTGTTEVCNQAAITGTNFAATATDDPTTGAANDPTCTPVDAAPDLGLVKSDGGVSAQPGDTISYSLTYSNDGSQQAGGVVLTETVPTNTIFNPGASTAGWACTPDNNADSSCTLNLSTVNVGSGSTATFAVTVDNPVAAGVTQINNRAGIDSSGAEADPADNIADDITPLIAASDLQLNKDDGGISGTPGATIAYTLVYTNAGNQSATGVVLTETVPTGTTFDAGASSIGWACTPDNNAGSLCTLSIGGLAGGGANGTRTFAVTVDDPFPAGSGQVSNSAAIGDDGANGADANPGDNTDTDTTPIDAGPDLALTKSDGGVTAVPGGVIVYTLSFTNTNLANQDAVGVTLTETVPANTSFNAGASSAGWICTPDNNASSLCTLSLGSVVIGSSDSRLFAVAVNNPVAAGITQIDNSAAVGSSGTDLNPANNSAADTTPLDAAPDLSLSKSDGGVDGVPGGGVSYTLTYTNAGDQAATGVALTETVPADTTFNAGASSAGWICTPDGNAGSVCSLTVGTVAGGGTNGTRTFAVTVDNPTPAGLSQLSNSAGLTDDGLNGADPTPGDRSSSDTTLITAQPDWQISKSDGGANVSAGGLINYSLTYTNAGNQGGTGVVLTETVPANTIFNAGASSAGWNCTPDGNADSTCSLVVGAMAGGSSASADFSVTVIDPLPTGTDRITNTVTIGDDGGNGPDPTPGNAATAVSLVGGVSGPVSVYMPLILKNLIGGPDLVVESMIAGSNTVTVVIRNQGTVPIVDAFWVDVYYDPNVTPGLNQPWPTIADHGLVWGVTGSGLNQLTPGGSLILTIGDAFYFADSSSPLPLPSGADVFVLVDSVDFATSYGAVPESNEGNNLFGPVISTVTQAGELLPAQHGERRPILTDDFPARQ